MRRERRPDRVDISASDANWAKAVRRERVLRPLLSVENLDGARVKIAAANLGVSAAHIYYLLRRFRQKPLTSTLLAVSRGPARGTRKLNAAIEKHVETAIEEVFLTRERPTLKRVLREVRRICRVAGVTAPSMKALRARVSSRSLRECIKAREGSASAGNRFRLVKPGLQTSRPLQIVQIDHTKVDIMLVDDVTRACIGRPWLSLAMDVYTRMVVGFYLSLDAPSATSAALVVAHGVLPKEDWLRDRSIDLEWPAQFLPETIHVDNGREFHSRAFTRGCQQHGIQIEYRPPATPRFGGHIERLMGTLMGRVHALPGSTSSNVAARGGYDSEAKATLSFREFERVLTLEVLGPYHNEVHSTLGRSPAAAWAAGIGMTPMRTPTEDAAFLLDFLPFEERTVRRDGIRLFNIFYQDGVLAHLVDNGRGKLRIKYDPRDLSAVFVELPSHEHLRVPYADLGRPPITLWEHREVVRRLRSEGRRTVNEHAIFAAIEEQRHILANAQIRSKAARRSLARLRQHPFYEKNDTDLNNAEQDSEAKVSIPKEGETSGVEFW